MLYTYCCKKKDDEFGSISEQVHYLLIMDFCGHYINFRSDIIYLRINIETLVRIYIDQEAALV
jgi:hypothetical protein